MYYYREGNDVLIEWEDGRKPTTIAEFYDDEQQAFFIRTANYVLGMHDMLKMARAFIPSPLSDE